MKAVAVDPSEDAAAWGRSQGVRVIRPADILSSDERFGIARFSHCIEHLLDPVSYLARVAEVLEPGGLLYIGQPVFPLCRPSETAPIYMNSVFPEHIHQFTALSLLRLLERTGFVIDYLFAFQKEKEVGALFEDARDREYADTALAPLRDLCPPHAPPLGAWPHFLGENIVCLAKRSS